MEEQGIKQIIVIDQFQVINEGLDTLTSRVEKGASMPKEKRLEFGPLMPVGQ